MLNQRFWGVLVTSIDVPLGHDRCCSRLPQVRKVEGNSETFLSQPRHLQDLQICLKHLYKTCENHMVEVLERNGEMVPNILNPYPPIESMVPDMSTATVLGRRCLFLEPKLCHEDFKVSTSFNLS